MKPYLIESYEAQYTILALQTELNYVKMRYGDNVRNYRRKVECRMKGKFEIYFSS